MYQQNEQNNGLTVDSVITVTKNFSYSRFLNFYVNKTHKKNSAIGIKNNLIKIDFISTIHPNDFYNVY